MKKKRFIFDLDHTLMTADYKVEKNYFRDVFKSDADIFITNVAELLYEYERLYPKYDIDDLSKFMTARTGLNFSREVVIGWIDSFGSIPNEIEDGVIETLDYLKSKKGSIAVLTNWFNESQEMRLRNSGLLEFVDDIYAGDTNLKPRRDAYLSARDRFCEGECVFIGDNLDKDYIGPRSFGMFSILYDKDDKHHENIVKIKRINDIKRVF